MTELGPPTPPGVNATIDERIAYLRAHAAFNDAITEAANRAFDRQFRKTLRAKVA